MYTDYRTIPEIIDSRIPKNVESLYYQYMNEREEDIDWNPHEGIHNHHDLSQFPAAHTLNFIGGVARGVKSELEINTSIPARIIPGSMALNGLKHYYNEVCSHPARRDSTFQQHTEYLRHHSGNVIDVHVTAALHKQLRRRDLPFRNETYNKLTGEIIPDVFAAQSIAIQNLPHQHPPQYRRIQSVDVPNELY